MKNKYLLIIIGFFFLFCFIVLFEGLKNPNVYKPKLQKEKRFLKKEKENKRLESLKIK